MQGAIVGKGTEIVGQSKREARNYLLQKSQASVFLRRGWRVCMLRTWNFLGTLNVVFTPSISCLIITICVLRLVGAFWGFGVLCSLALRWCSKYPL